VTLILAQASSWFASEVSDRLVTRAGRHFDPVANKSVIYLAPDGVCSMAYTGLAYIDGVPTDQWIAGVLAGHVFERGRPPSLRLGRIPSWRHIGPTLDNLASRLTMAWTSERQRPFGAPMFEVLVTGWQWDRRQRARPIVIGVRKNAGQSHFRIERAPRHLGRNFVAAATPEGNVNPDEIELMRSRLRAIRSADEAERILVDTIRSVSARPGTKVGADCMSIMIPKPSLRIVRVRYIPISPARLAIRSRSDDRLLMTAPAAFSPWVIGRDLVHAPSILSGRFAIRLGQFTVELEAPEPSGSGLRSALGALERPASP
jgi:hypothetical protein